LSKEKRIRINVGGLVSRWVNYSYHFISFE
jgi:hypothetical protein